MRSQVQMTTLADSTERDPLHGVPVANLPPAAFAWSEWSAGRVTLVDQVNGEGHRIVVLSPSVSTAGERSLTAIEERIARRAGQALTNKQIAAEMRLSQTAVENHLSRALRKLRLRDRIALARLYTQLEAAGRI